MARKKLTKTDRKITRLVVAAEQQLKDRRARLDHIIGDHIDRFTNDDLQSIEAILCPILGRLVLEREAHRMERGRDSREDDEVES